MDKGCIEKASNGWLPLIPDAPGRFMWDVFTIFLLAYTLVVTPLKLGFGIIDLCPTGEWVFDLVIDFTFMFDLCLNFFTAVFVQDTFGEPHLSGRMDVIAREYLKSWFAIDLLSSFPIDVIVSLAVEGCPGEKSLGNTTANVTTDQESTGVQETAQVASMLRMVRLLRMVKLLKILRILKLRQRFNELADNFPRFANLRVIQLSGVLVTIVYIAHILSCGFYFVGSHTKYDSGPELAEHSWIDDADIDPKPTCGV